MEVNELLPTIAWRTLAKNVYPITAETTENPATFRMTVSPADINDVGAGEIEIGCYVKDYIGSTFSVIAFTDTTVDLKDDFRRGFAPQTGQWAILYKSVSGSPYLAQIYYKYLNSSALDYSRQLELAILYNPGNANLTTVNWSAKNLTLNGVITGATTGTFSSYIKATTGKFSNLTGTFFPYNKLDGSGLADSLLSTDGINTFINSGAIGTDNFVSGLIGWRGTYDGIWDMRYLYTDELHAKAFTADVSQALAGADFLTKSVSKLSSNFKILPVGSSSQMLVDDLEGFSAMQCFVNGDYIRLRVFDRSGGGLIIADVWGLVTLDTTYGDSGFEDGIQAYTFTVTDCGDATDLVVYKGAEVLDYGTTGSGVIERTTLDAQGSPYSQVVTWVDDPSISTNYSLHTRTGNLNGIAHCSGYGFYGDNIFLTKKILIGDLTKLGDYMEYTTENGLVVAGQITITGGNAATKTDVSDAKSDAISTAKDDAQDLVDDIQEDLNAYITATNNTIDSLQNQVDGQVDSWFEAYSPTLTNYPASEWTTDDLKAAHIGDTFTNTESYVDDDTTPDAGKSWRFVESNGVYSWTSIADSDAVKALLKAAEAQDTADNKRRVFTTTPTTPYDVGDLWTQGDDGDLMKCITAKADGTSYSASDWNKAVKYTDDTAVDNIEIGGRNLLRDTSDEWIVHSTSSNNSFAVYKSIYLSDLDLNVGDIYTFSAKTRNATNYNKVEVSFNSTNSWISAKISDEGIDFLSFSIPENTYRIDLGFSIGVSSSIEARKLKLEKGTKATDWTPAPEDDKAYVDAMKEAAVVDAGINADGKVTASEAKIKTAYETYTNTAKAAAISTANSYADGKVIAAESSLKTAYTNLVNAEKQKAIDTANAYSDDKVSTEEQARLDADEAVITAYKAEVVAAKAAAVQEANATADGKITDSEKAITTAYKDYTNKAKAAAETISKAYADGIVTKEEQARINEANAKLIAAKEHAESLVDDIEIGGRNVLRKQDFYNWAGVTFDEYLLTFTGSSTGVRLSNTRYDALSLLTLSFKMKRISGDIVNIGGHTGGHKVLSIYFDGVYKGTNFTGNSVHYPDDDLTHEVIVKYQAPATITDYLYIQPNRTQPSYTMVCQIWDIKLEKGNKATDWTPAPEDVASDIADAAKTAVWSSTNITGIPDYIADTTPDNALGIGNDFMGFHSTGNDWPIRIYNDNNVGKFYAGNTTNYVNWDGSTLAVKGDITATSGTFTGTIHAGDGTIGKFTIGDYLYTQSKIAYNDGFAGVHVGSDGIGLGANFSVSAAGALKVSGADISGKINALTGTLGTLTIGENGYIKLPTSWDFSVAGNLDNTGLNFMFNSDDSQAVSWYTASGFLVTQLKTDHSGHLKATNVGIVENAHEYVAITNANTIITCYTDMLFITSISSGANIIGVKHIASNGSITNPKTGEQLTIINTTTSDLIIHTYRHTTSSNIAAYDAKGSYNIRDKSSCTLTYYNSFWYLPVDVGQ